MGDSIRFALEIFSTNASNPMGVRVVTETPLQSQDATVEGMLYVLGGWGKQDMFTEYLLFVTLKQIVAYSLCTDDEWGG